MMLLWRPNDAPLALLDNRYPDRADMGGGADVYERWRCGMTEQEREELIEMSEDIVTRLHKCAEWHKGTSADCEEWMDAAKEITRLREENARVIRENKVAFEAVGGVVKANDKLKEENARLREALQPFVPETQLIDPAIPDTRPIDVMVRAGELRAARAAILRKVKDEAACPAPDEAP